MKNSGAIVLGIVAAAAVGVAVGVAFAPDKGVVTRKKLKKKVNRTASDLKDLLEESKNKSIDKVTELLEAGKEKAQELKAAYVPKS